MDIDKLTTTAIEFGATWGVKVLGVLAALLAAWVVGGAVRRRIVATLERRKFDLTLSRFFANGARYAIIGGAVLGCLGVFGIETASFAALVAAMGLAIGLAFQGSLSNFAAGMMLLIFRPFKVGELIKVNGELGIVEELELFTTELRTLDNRQIIMPNGTIFGATIESLTHYDTRRVDVPVGTDYSADIEETRKILEAAVAKVAGGLKDPAPQIFLSGLGASSVDWQLRVWCKTEDYWTVWQDTITICKTSLEEAQIGIPFPQLDLHLPGEVVDRLTKVA